MSVYLTNAHFPNNTTLYIWNIRGGSDVTPVPNDYGGIDLTRTGALTSGTGHLGDSVFCGFDGTNDYLSSTDAAFNFTGTFSAGGWFYANDWTSPAANKYLMGRLSGGTGWDVYLDSTANAVQIRILGVGAVSLSTAGLADGSWHHIAFTNTSGGAGLIPYLDGVVGSTSTGGTFSQAGNLEVGASNGGSFRWAGAVQDVFVHNGTALSGAQITTVYNAAAPAATPWIFIT